MNINETTSFEPKSYRLNMAALRELLDGVRSNRGGQTEAREPERPKQSAKALQLLLLLVLTGCGPIMISKSMSESQSVGNEPTNTGEEDLGKLKGYGGMNPEKIFEVFKSDPSTWPVGARYTAQKGDTYFELVQRFYGEKVDPFVAIALVELRSNKRGTLRDGDELLFPNIGPFEVLPEYLEPVYAVSPNIGPTPTLMPGAPRN